jgi:Zn-dependent protease with chaperone function
LIVFSTLYLVVTFLLDLPLFWYAGFYRQHLYGLSNHTFFKWASDNLKELAFNIVIVPLVAWVPLLIIQKRPRSWWFYCAVLTVPLIAAALLLTPIVFDPLFNDFHRMNDRVLEAKILKLADRAGIEGSRVFEVDKSVDTKTVNAYVTGFLSSKRIVLWDTTMRTLNEREIMSVLGHEIGHFVLGHVAQFITVGALVALLAFWFVHLTASRLLPTLGARLGLQGLHDFAAVPLLLFLFSLATFILTPALLALSRHNEHEADRFSLELTHDNHAAATSFVKMQEDNLANPYPSPVVVFFRSSHPPNGARIEFANDYHPWLEGRPLRYSRHFH